MSNIKNIPDKWVMLKLSYPKTGITYKVLASWYGGYAGSDSWKLSSGTKAMIVHDDHLEFPQHSGSTYCGSIHNYGMSYYTESVLAGFMNQVKNTDASIVVLEYDEIVTLEFPE